MTSNLSVESVNEVTLLATPGALASVTIASLAAALAKAQGAMGNAQKNSNNDNFQSRYADLSSVVDAIRGPLSKNGLSYLQRTHPMVGQVAVETLILHESGEFLSAGIMAFPVLNPLNLQDHALANTYVRRYALQTAFGIASADDDGNAAAMLPGPSVATVKKVVQKLPAATSTAAASVTAKPAASTAANSVPVTPAASTAAASVPATPAASTAAASVTAKPAASTAANSVPVTPAASTVAASVPATPAASTVAASVPATSEAPANDAESLDLISKVDFLNTVSDIKRLDSAKQRAGDFFKIAENAAKFVAAIDKRVLALSALPA